MVLGNFPCRGILLVWMIVGHGPIALTEGVGGGLFVHFYSPLSFLSSFSLSLGIRNHIRFLLCQKRDFRK